MLCPSEGLLHRLTKLIPGIKSVQKFLTNAIPLIRYIG